MQKRVRAIIITSDKLLLIHRIKNDKEYWVFPGGKVEENESEESALVRECKEEIGVEISVGRKFCTSSYYSQEEENRQTFYFAEIISGKIGNGKGPEFQKDSGYVGQFIFEYISLDKIGDYQIFPEEVKNKLVDLKL